MRRCTRLRSRVVSLWAGEVYARSVTDSERTAFPTSDDGDDPDEREATVVPIGRQQASPSPLGAWLMTGLVDDHGAHQGPHAQQVEQTHPWWRVMCLTGLDYFSTLGYQPAIAALAAGVIAPFATLVLVALTLLGALPVYRRVAAESFRGSGSIAMLERLLPWWAGKLFVLVLLGFAATDFMITITLSAADASAHAIANPFAPSFFAGGQVWITLVLILLLGLVFLKGFREAIRIAVVLVALFLVLNLIVVAVSIGHVFQHPLVVDDWWRALFTQHGDPWLVIGIALIVFPKLALGLSGFETGVAVMPQIHGTKTDAHGRPIGRIRGARRLMTTAAIIMSTFLITSSFATTLLIPQEAFRRGGEANGRALAYLAHEFLGEGFGTVYDISTILILWFAGASAMAGLLNLVPRYLPRYGMAPQWARAVRPLVIVFTVVAMVITVVFKADVDAQGGAYATGVLVLITSASVAVTISARHKRQRVQTICFGAITLVFLYTTIVNIIERPDGLRIASLFILGILVISVVSRIGRSYELRSPSVSFDPAAMAFLSDDAQRGKLLFIAHEPHPDRGDEYAAKDRDERRFSNIPALARTIFIEVHPSDSSDFEEELEVHGVTVSGYRVLRVRSGNVPNTIAAVLLAARDVTGVVPTVFCEWSEGSPLSNTFKFLISGVGAVGTATREVLREAEPNAKCRPAVHVV